VVANPLAREWDAERVVGERRDAPRHGCGIERGTCPVARRLPPVQRVGGHPHDTKLSRELRVPTPTGQQVPILRLT